MKVELKEPANLVITPENGTENYALQKWFEGYTKAEPSPETLSIELIKVKEQPCTE